MLGRSLLMAVLLGSLSACTPQTARDSNPASSVSPQATPSTSVRQSTIPPAQTKTIQIEGTPQQVAIEFVQTSTFSTYFPNDRFALQRGGGSGEGTATWFYWKQPDGTVNQNAYVQIFFPGKNQSVRQLRQFLVGERGIFKANGWQTVNRGSGDSYAEIAYSSWLRDLILFKPRNNSQNMTGTAYLGELGGRAFYVIAYYPREYADGFTPRADVILKNLKQPLAQLNNTSQLELKGIGAIQVGMTVAEASKAIGQPLLPPENTTSGKGCTYVAPRPSILGLDLMVIDDRIARIDVRKPSSITTLSGAKIGDSEARIQQLYPGRISVTPHKYSPGWHYLTFTPKDAKDSNYRLIFETNGKQVMEFRSGRLPEVTWVERCG